MERYFIIGYIYAYTYTLGIGMPSSPPPWLETITSEMREMLSLEFQQMKAAQSLELREMTSSLQTLKETVKK